MQEQGIREQFGSATRTGFAYGVDMTDEMLDLARANAAKAEHHLTSHMRAEGGSYVGFIEAEVMFTHEVAPGMHGAVMHALKPAAA